MSRPTRGSIEAQIADAVVKFQREQQGRGPQRVQASLFADMVLVRSSGVLTPNETHLAATEEGRRLIRSARQELRGINKSEIERVVGEIVGCGVLRSYGDMSVEAAEQVEVFILDEDVEGRLLRRPA